MEKVIIVGDYKLDSYDATDVNKYLNEGWIIKSIQTITNKDYMSAIFVLEKK